MPRYCIRCILPDTRAGVKLDADGVCLGCRNAEAKTRIDWDARAAEFRQLVAETRRRGCRYDCAIPVSGGKDSFWQVVTCLEGFRNRSLWTRREGRGCIDDFLIPDFEWPADSRLP